MSKRFMLTAAGMSAAAIGGSASAAVMTFNYDAYFSEASWMIIDSGSNVVASASRASSPVSGWFPVTASVAAAWSTATYVTSGGTYIASLVQTVDLDLASGDYTIVLMDTWGDGWTYNAAGGASAFVYGDLTLAFTGGSTANASFSVVPAPGALALLGLAGLAGTRRRRA